MESVRLPMHLPDGSLVLVSDVLAAFPENDAVWVVFEFFGTGRDPLGMGMPEFEDRVRSTPEGLRMAWAELRAFAADLEQAFDCEIAAFWADDYSATRRNVDLPIAKICAFDSTEWYVAVDRTAQEFQSVLGAVQRIATRTT